MAGLAALSGSVEGVDGAAVAGVLGALSFGLAVKLKGGSWWELEPLPDDLAGSDGALAIRWLGPQVSPFSSDLPPLPSRAP